MKKTESLAASESRKFTEEDIRIAFQTFDLDKNMYLGPGEIRHILSLIGEQATTEEVDEMIRMCDSDGSGFVSFDDFRSIFTGKDSRSKSLASNVQPALTKRRNSGITSGDTLGDMLAEYCSSNAITPQFIRSIYKRFQEVDATRSGRIGYLEFLRVMKSDDTDFMKRLFDVFDFALLNEIEIKHFIVNLIVHSQAIKHEEKLKIAFSMMRSTACPANSIDKQSFRDLLTTFFAGYPASLKTTTLDDRVDEAFKSSKNGYLGLDDFMDVAEISPNVILPPPLLKV